MPIQLSPTSPRVDRTRNNRFESNVSFGPVVYGDKRPGRFLEDVAAGRNSLDIIVMADSNACSSFQIGSYGYNEGIPQALNSLGLPMYGTGFFYAQHRGTQGSDGFYSAWRSVAPSFTGNSVPNFLGTASGNAELGSTASGDDAATLGTLWNSPAERTGYASIENSDWVDWSFIKNSGNNLFTVRGITVTRGHPFANTSLTIKYRPVIGGTVSGTGRIYCSVWQQGPINAQPRTNPTGSPFSTTVAAGTAASDRVLKPEWSFNSPSTDGYTVGIFGADANGVNFTRGPFGFLGHSLYTVRKGWAVHTHHHGSGRTSTQIATAVTNAASSTRLAQELKEIRDRQIAAGGSGRVMLFWNSGVNGPEPSGSTWEAAVISTWNHYKSVWQSLGFDVDDLCMVASVTHVSAPGTTAAEAVLPAVRAHANKVPQRYPDLTVVDLSAVAPFEFLAGYQFGGIPFYQSYNGYPKAGDGDTFVHLSGGPCEYVSVAPAATVTTASSITFTGAAAKTADNYWTGGLLDITTVNGSANSPAYQSVPILGYNGTTKVATVGSWLNGQQPTNGASIGYNVRRASHSDGYGMISRMILTGLMSAT